MAEMPEAKTLHIAKRALPAGWRYVGRSGRYPNGEVETRRLFGRELVVHRTEGGRFAVADPHCPNLGHGGTLRVSPRDLPLDLTSAGDQ